MRNEGKTIMYSEREQFFSLLRNALSGTVPTRDEIESFRVADWDGIFRLAASQGVLAVVWDAVARLPAECMPQRVLKIRWALGAENIADRYRKSKTAAAELAAAWCSEGLSPVVLKGFAVSRYYPVPEYRECGDFDCFLGAGRDRGDEMAAAVGATIERPVGYKHTHIHYKGLMVENHRFCIGIRGSRRAKAFERILEDLLEHGGEPEYVEQTCIRIPGPNFNALFLVWHALIHFLMEGIRIRHVCDWACFVAAEQERVDWQEFYELCDAYHLRRFADALTAISVKYLGLRVTSPAVVTESPYAVRILDSILDDDSSVFNRGKGKWWSRTKMLSNVFQYRWKYREIYQKGYFGEMMRLVAGFVFDRNPKV